MLFIPYTLYPVFPYKKIRSSLLQSPGGLIKVSIPPYIIQILLPYQNELLMKRNMLTALLLLSSFAVLAQQKTSSGITDNQKWKVRLRAIAAVPPSSSYDLSGADIKISTSVVPELDFTYFFTKNLAAELILGTTHHQVKLKDAEGSAKLGKVWLLPPTLNLQYHYPAGAFNPYIGAGVNYTIFYGAKDQALSLDYKNKFGFSTQLGFDYNLNEKWFLNVDVKRIFLNTDVTVKGAGTTLKNVDVDPFIFGLGIGTRF